MNLDMHLTKKKERRTERGRNYQVQSQHKQQHNVFKTVSIASH